MTKKRYWSYGHSTTPCKGARHEDRSTTHPAIRPPARPQSRGRAHVLNQIAEAEDNGEARVFDDAIALVDDPALKKLIARHRDDEIRHGQLFRAALKRTNVDPGPVPDELKIIDRISRKMAASSTSRSSTSTA